MYFLVTAGMLVVGIWMVVSAARNRNSRGAPVLVNIGVLLALVGGLGLLAGWALPRFLV